MANDDAPQMQVVLNEIMIRSGLDQDGDVVFATKFTVAGTDNQLIPFIEGLGLLEAAKDNFIERWSRSDSEA